MMCFVRVIPRSTMSYLWVRILQYRVTNSPHDNFAFYFSLASVTFLGCSSVSKFSFPIDDLPTSSLSPCISDSYYLWNVQYFWSSPPEEYPSDEDVFSYFILYSKIAIRVSTSVKTPNKGILTRPNLIELIGQRRNFKELTIKWFSLGKFFQNKNLLIWWKSTCKGHTTPMKHT